MNCINIHTKEFQELLEATKLPSLLLEMRISDFQEEYGIYSYPTFDEIREINFKKIELNSLLNTNNKSEIFTPIEVTFNKESEQNFSNINKELLFNSEPRKILSASEVLRNIINSNILDKTKNGVFFLEKAFNLLNKSGAKFKVISKEDFDNKIGNNSEGTIMLYNSTDNEIYTTNEIMSEMAPESILEAFIHEVVHSITVKAYFNPQTFEEHEYKKFIDDAYEQYKYLGEETDGNGNLMYGFENQVEFIAEIYSNPKFRTKLQSLEKNWWNNLIDAIRRLFTLPKSLENNKIISSALLFETVEKWSEKDMSKWKGTIFNDPKYSLFAKKAENIHTELKTIDDKIQYNLDRINESLKINIQKYEQYAKYYKDNEGIKYYIEKLNNLKSSINQYSDVNQIQGIIIFLEQMGETLDYVEKKLDSIDHTDPENIRKTARIQDQYLTTYSVLNDIKQLLSHISENNDEKIITKDELNKINDIFDARSGKYERLNSRILELKKKATKELLTNIQYFPNIEKKHKDRLANEYRNNKIPQDKETWIIDKLNNRDKDLIEKDLVDAVDNFINNPAFDIYSTDVTFSSAINVSSPMVQIMYQLLTKIDNDRLEEERKKDLEFKKLFEELIKEKRTNNVNELFKNILDYDSNDKPYLRSEYSSKFYSDVHLKIRDLRKEQNAKIRELEIKRVELSKAGKINSDEYKKLTIESKEIKDKLKEDISKIEKANFTYDDKKKINGIKDKWKNKDINLSKAERKVLDFFIETTDQSHKDTYGKDSLIKYSYGTKFYELPKITKSDAERIWSGGSKDILSDKWKDLTEIRPDDIGYSTIETDMNNNPIYSLKIHYRDSNNKLENKNQSLDLFNVYRMEYKNGSAYKHRSKVETDLNFLMDVAKNQKYYEVKGTQNVINKRNQKSNLLEKDSNTVKMMQNMMETKFYDIMNITGTKIGSVDMNKAVGFVNSASAFLTLSLNIASGTANVLNANAQIFLESFIKGHHIKASGIKKANEIYGKDLKNNLADVTNGIKTSFTNQILEMFNVKGEFLFSEANFLKSDLLKMGLNTESLQVFQNSGEHWLQSVITMSVLDGIKVLNSNNKFINKNGKEVANFADAASLLDMLNKNEDGLLVINPVVVYTTHSRMSSLQNGGKEKIDMLITKKIYDSAGNYRKTDQSEMYRHWGGKLLGLYRKYLVPMGQARLRGIEYSLIKKEDLTDKEKRFSYALQEDEEGTYVTLIRYLKSSIKNGQKWLLLKQNWNELTDYEQHNIKRAVTEIVLTSILTPLAAMLAGAAGDDDDEFLYFIAYQMRRMDTELSAYRSLSEQFKMLRSPIPSARLLEHCLQTLENVLNPFSWNTLNDDYQVGPHKGKNKFLIRQEKQLPVVRDFLRSYEDLYDFQNKSVSGFGT